MNKELFYEYLKKLNINLTSKELEQLEIYKNILIEYNLHTNLTAIKDEEGIYLKHFYDSLTLQKYLSPHNKILDIGTGAGFPGMVLAIINPHCQFTLLDSNHKKIKFLEYLNSFLQLSNVEFINDRAEVYVKNNLEKFDIVTSRAVADLRIIAELSIPALKINGLFIPLKSHIEEEYNNSFHTLKILGGELIKKEEFTLPIENSKRTILVIKHSQKTSSLYPRSYDKILKKPLKK